MAIAITGITVGQMHADNIPICCWRWRVFDARYGRMRDQKALFWGWGEPGSKGGRELVLALPLGEERRSAVASLGLHFPNIAG